MRIPVVPLVLGLAGLLPFAWGVLTMWMPDLGLWTARVLGARMVGPYVQLSYGIVILSFMSGVLWGFAARENAAVGYGLSVLPALWAFFMVSNGPVSAAVSLAVGFIGLLALDWQFSTWGLTPAWWVRLRVILTAGVLACLAPVIW